MAEKRMTAYLMKSMNGRRYLYVPDNVVVYIENTHHYGSEERKSYTSRADEEMISFLRNIIPPLDLFTLGVEGISYTQVGLTKVEQIAILPSVIENISNDADIKRIFDYVNQLKRESYTSFKRKS